MSVYANTIVGRRIQAADGYIGSTKDLLFDDVSWDLRYVVVDTSDWLPGRKVLIPPQVVTGLRSEGVVRVELTKEKIRNSPDVDADKPVSRQLEAGLYGYYGWAPYWGSPEVPPIGIPPSISREEQDLEIQAGRHGDPSLRSVKEVQGYRVKAIDGTIGHIEDFIVNDEVLRIVGIVLDTRNWLPGKKVAFDPTTVRRFRWSESQVEMDLTRDEIAQAPSFPPGDAVNEDRTLPWQHS